MDLDYLKDYLQDDTIESFEVYHLERDKTDVYDSIDDLPEDLEICSFDFRNGKVMPIMVFNVEE